MTKYYYYNQDKDKVIRAYPLYYREGSRFVRFSDYFRAEDGGILIGDMVFDENDNNQNVFDKSGEINKLTI